MKLLDTFKAHNGSKHIQQGGWETLFVGLQNLRAIGITLGVSSNTWPTWPLSQLSRAQLGLFQVCHQSQRAHSISRWLTGHARSLSICAASCNHAASRSSPSHGMAWHPCLHCFAAAAVLEALWGASSLPLNA